MYMYVFIGKESQLRDKNEILDTTLSAARHELGTHTCIYTYTYMYVYMHVYAFMCTYECIYTY
jgi:hypothetical protein